MRVSGDQEAMLLLEMQRAPCSPECSFVQASSKFLVVACKSLLLNPATTNPLLFRLYHDKTMMMEPALDS